MYIVIYILIISFSFSQSELSERYSTLQEIEQQLNTWSEEFSTNTDPYAFYPGDEGIIYHHEIIGYSGVDELPIWAVKLTMNADLNEDKPKVLILGQCHAEEIYGVEIAMDLIQWMLYPMEHTSYIQAILSIMTYSEVWIIPTYNPEGLSVVHGWYDDLNYWNQDVTYRKNKFDANGNGFFDFIIGPGEDLDGVDLNRNYDFNWIFGDDIDELDNGGCNPSYITNYDYYRGPEPFSEPEVLAIKEFVMSKNFLLSIAYHSSRSGCVSEKVIYPWEWSENKPSPDFDVISRLGIEIANLIPKEAESGYYYPVGSQSRKGNAHDWLYANTGCFQYLIEVGSENIQPDDVDLIENTIEKNIIGALHLLKRASGTNIQNGPDVYQIKGIVSNQGNGEPLVAEVSIDEMDGPMLKPRYTDQFGRYRRLLIEGTYTINFKSYGYESQSYTFVPSSSQITEYNVALVALQQNILNLSLNYPSNLDEIISIVVESQHGKDTLIYNAGFQYSLPHDEYKLMIYSENLFPEIIEFDMNQDTLFQLDMKWKAVEKKYTFDWDDQWNINGLIHISDGLVSSQQNLFYNNSINNTMTSINQFEDGEYVIELDLRYELEWENDILSFFSSCEGCVNDTLEVFSGHNWNWDEKFIPFNVSANTSKNINLNILCDDDLYYRGFEIDNLAVLYKPDGECETGDVVLDGIINVLDIIEMVGIILNDDYNGFQECTADLNFDGFIDVMDITAVISVIIGE